jgi:hypothetical protein
MPTGSAQTLAALEGASGLVAMLDRQSKLDLLLLGEQLVTADRFEIFGQRFSIGRGVVLDKCHH